MSDPARKKMKSDPKQLLSSDEMGIVFSFADTPSMINLACCNKTIHSQYDEWIQHLVNSDRLHTVMRGKGFDPRVSLVVLSETNTKEWMKQYRENHPLQMVIYYKALL